MRARFFGFALCCYVGAYVVYWLGQCHVMRVLAGAYFGVTTGVMLSTLKWKVSVHAAGVAGPGTALLCMYGLTATPVILVWLAVLWARPVLKQHTATEGTGGLLLGILITLATYAVLY
jgi:membrane-associated phospholipid phosphatase